MSFTEIQNKLDEIISIMKRDKVKQFSQKNNGISIKFKEVKNGNKECDKNN